MAGVASQFITLTDEYQLLPANAINIVVVGVTGTPNLVCSGDNSTDHQEITLAAGDNQITENILHYVKLSTGSAKLYYGVE